MYISIRFQFLKNCSLSGGTCFAKIDFSYVCLQVELDDHFRELLTINTYQKLFQYTLVPLGVHTAPATL